MKTEINKTVILFSIFSVILILYLLITIGNLIISQLVIDAGALWKTMWDSSVLKSIWISFSASFVSTAIAFLFGTPLAYFLARKNFPGKNFIESLIDVPVIIPHTVAGIALISVFGYNGLIGSPLEEIGIRFVDAFPGIVVAMLFVSIPFYINHVREGFESIDPKLENVARTLGESEWGTFRTITLPLAYRDVLAGSIMSWARGISEFGAVILITYYPMIAPVLIFERFRSFGLGASRPIAVVLILVSILIFVILRYLSRGWSLYAKD
ncbi:MAG: ABC-type sulfate transport system, permease component [Candidatus Methanohalarchaeum thermophilum]|uniref:ABC-type sulfate transport system, permease component n=1 Tax=Methanohalarchaeum thermophilum TaxID=1903181 RepID=A0A1Q6DWD4_METT1|nr:MAG: ABC-type sulfate transport system, permease component [Candidatus Methanohalarchaeum thermophilum]